MLKKKKELEYSRPWIRPKEKAQFLSLQLAGCRGLGKGEEPRPHTLPLPVPETVG